MSRPYPQILSRHTDKNEAQKAWIHAHFLPIEGSRHLRWRSNVYMRKMGSYWCILLRSQTTVHAGNKKWRRKLRQGRKAQ